MILRLKNYKLKTLALFIFTFFISIPLFSSSPLEPLKLDNPRDTMRSFMVSMNNFKKLEIAKSKEAFESLDEAVRTLNLEGLPYLVQTEEGRRRAKLLKEVIDRVILVDYSKIPEDPQFTYWRLKDTEIVISKVVEGDRQGAFLFSKDTVKRVDEFYQKVKKLPYLKGSGQGALYSEPFTKKYIPQWAQEKLLGLEKWQWVGLFLAILFGYIVKTLSQFVFFIVKKITDKRVDSTRHKVVLAIEKPTGLIIASAFWFLCIHSLRFEGITLSLLLVTVQVIFSVSIVWAAYRLCDVATAYLATIANKTDSDLDDQLVPLLSKALRVFVVLIGVLVSIQNLGFNVMSILAGLGLGGLAFALAAKDTAANLFGSIMILIDQPFKVGDWIVTGGIEGNVTEIGFRSTRIRTFYDSLITVPNSVIANANIDNMGDRTYRRDKSIIGITYGTPPQKIEAFLEGIKNIIKTNPHTRKDNLQIIFKEYGNFSLNILLYYFLKVPDWSSELLERQNIYLEIMKLAEKLGIEFAFPTQTLHIDSLPKQEKFLPL